MAGLAKICKMYGSIEVIADGKKITWLWDHANNKPRLQTEMTKEEIMASEKAEWTTTNKPTSQNLDNDK